MGHPSPRAGRADVTWNHSDNVTVVLNLLVPWGTFPEDGLPTSEYGTPAFTIFLQARIYD